jgi:hypothetical protein
MANSQFPSAAATLTEDVVSESQVEVTSDLQQPDLQQPDLQQPNLKSLNELTLNQVVLTIADAVKPPDSGIVAAAGVGISLPTRLLDATQRLVELIGQLRSPHGGWPADVPQTPETLLPYVMEEACDVWDVRQEMPTDAPVEGHELGVNLAHVLHRPTVVSALAPWLLWAIARSAYDIMGLLEGITARVFQPDEGWQSGCLRLVAFLQINLPEQADSASTNLDLTTHQFVRTLLPPTAMVQAVDNDLCQEPIWVEGLLQGLLQHIQTMTPSLVPLIQGLPVEALVPYQSWQSGSVQLQLGLEFVASDALPSDSLPEPCEPGIADVEAESAMNPTLRFTDSDWLRRYTLAVTRQQFLSVMTYAAVGSEADPGLEPEPPDARKAIAQTVQEACKVADFLKTAPTVASRNFPQRDWSINAVSLRLLWSMSRNAYEIMPLLTGIQSDVLEPKSGWQSGLLRLVVCLHIQTPELDWQLDLVTGDLLPTTPHYLAADAVVQLHQASWQHQPTPLEAMRDSIMQHIQHVTPELQLFLTGTYIDVLDADHHWQPGILHLSIDFQFIPRRMQ